MVRKIAVLAVVLALTLAAGATTVGIVAQEQDGATTDAAERQDTSHLRVVHAAPNASAVNVAIDNETVGSDLAFGDASEYVNVTGDEVELRVTVADGATDGGNATDGENATDGGNATAALDGQVDVAGEVVLEETHAVDNRTVTTLVLHAGEDAGDDLEVADLQDDAWEPGEDASAVRVAHLAPDAGDVDVTVSGADDAGVTDGAGVAGNETAGAGAAEDGADDAGTAGNEPADAGAAGDGADDAGAAGNETGDAGADGADGGAAPAPDDGTVIAESLSYNETSDYVTVQAGDGLTVDVRESGLDNNGTVITSIENAGVEAGAAHTVLVVGGQDEGLGTAVGLQTEMTQDATVSVNLPTDGATDETEAPDGGADAGAGEGADAGAGEGDDAGAGEGGDAGAEGAGNEG